MRRHNLFTIAPFAPFLEVLAKKILDGTLLPDWNMQNDFALSDITIMLPSARARLQLAEEFAKICNGATLLPNILVFGGNSEEEEVFLPPYEGDEFLPPISFAKRRLIIGKLVEKFFAQNQANMQISTSEILALSDSLCELIDDIYTEQIDFNKIKTIPPQNLATYWQQSLEFLNIALKAWPEILAELGHIDRADLRNKQLLRQAQYLEQIYKDKPLIAAGSTGSIPATANLLKSIKNLKYGVIVLPGLDVNMTREEFASLLRKDINPHSHPQYGLAQLLKRLEELPSAFIELTKNDNNEKIRKNRILIAKHAAKLAKDSANWQRERKNLASIIEGALAKVQIIKAENDELQARAIALAVLDGVNNKKTIGIISPDRNLARRIIAELKRFKINVDDSAGTPLFHTKGARFIRQILALLISNYAAIDIVALLHNKLLSLSLKRTQIGKLTNLLELAILRTTKLAAGLDNIKQKIALNLQGKDEYAYYRLNESEAKSINNLLNRLKKALEPLEILFRKKKFTILQFCNALEETIIRTTKLHKKSDKNEKAKIERELAPIFNWLNEQKLAGEIAPILEKRDIEKTIIALMSGTNIRQARANNQNMVAIWGQLEARLQNRNIIIMAGLNETVWPKIADPGPWLSRNMKLTIALEPPERRQGQAAHDFFMALGNEEVIISYSQNIGTTPALASRFLSRLSAFVGEEEEKKCEQRGQKWLKQAKKIDFVKQPEPATRPTPIPPANMRPKSLSITEIETLIRSPYDIYAKYILRLRAVDSLGADIGAREKGNIIHLIFERFIKENIDPNSDDAFKQIMQIAREEIFSLYSDSERQILWLERFKQIGKSFIAFEKEQRKNIKNSFVEVKGKWSFPVGGEIFSLRGKADRIDILNDNNVQIIDYKTGTIPPKKNIQKFLAPQLLLEALMVKNGAFEKIGNAKCSALKYIKVKAGEDALEIKDFPLEKNSSLEDYITEINRRLMGHIEALLLSDKTPLSAHILPNPSQKFISPYDHLARVKEWTIMEDEEGGE